MKLVYPAKFYYEKEGGYSVEVPDLVGCVTQGETLEEAIEMAQDAALGWLLTAIEEEEEIPKPSTIEEIKIEKEGFKLTAIEEEEEIPKPSTIEEIKIEKEGFKTLLLLNIDEYTEKYGSKKSIKKTLTIPQWLNKRAEKLGINFSQALQEILLSKIVKMGQKK